MMRTQRFVAAVAVVGAALLVGSAPSAGDRGGGALVYGLSSLETVRPRGSPAGDQRVRIEAARGEWESLQVVVRAGAEPLAAVEVEAAPLVGPGGARLALRLYRVAFIDLRTPSNAEGGTGAWPDPLIPAVDGFAGERRRAFPVAVAPGADAAAWVDVFVPRDAPAGTYRGEVSARDGQHALGRVAVELTVHAFSLPATSSLPVTFGISTNKAVAGHCRKPPCPTDDAAARELTRRYAVAALRDRISLHGMSFEPAPFTVDAGGHVHVDFRPYDAEVGPFLDGRADPGGPADGARWTAFDLRIPARLDGRARVEYTRAMVAHLAERGWLSRVFAYVADEPPDADLPKVRERALALHEAAPRVPRLVTRAPVATLDGAVDIWCPIVNHLDDKPDAPPHPSRAAYEPRLARGERLWWYQSCLSHGCDIVGEGYFADWPSRVVDSAPVAQRVQPWLTFHYRVGGELYFDTVDAYDGDPWHDVLRHGGNGDGTLFYPGRPDVIGGTSDIPVESIRLKRIRDGLEDYEYLRLYSDAAGFAAADRLAVEVASRTFRFHREPGRLLGIRAEIARRLDARASARR